MDPAPISQLRDAPDGGTAQAAGYAHWFPKYYSLPFCLGGAVKHVPTFHLFILRQPHAVTPMQEGGREILPGSDILGASSSQQDPWKRTGHPWEVGSRSKPESALAHLAQLAYFSADLS